MVTLRGATDREIAEQWRLLATAGVVPDASGATGTTGSDERGPAGVQGDGWPGDEATAVVAALRLLLELPAGTASRQHHTGRSAWAHRVAERSGRQWAAAHRSARVMWERLLVLPTVLVDPGDPDSGVAVERSVRAIADHAADEALSRLEQAALLDPLTGAGNRRALHADLARALAQVDRFGQQLALVMIDLDGLKETNDRDGHAAGDQALVALADTFRSHLRAGDALYRIGGDEFVAVLAGASADDVPDLLGRVARSAPPFSWGTAATSAGSARITDLLAAADADLYQRRRSLRSGTALALVGTAAVAQRPTGHARSAAERARLRARAASAALVAGLTLAGGTAPLVETGVLHVALPPRSVTEPTVPPFTTIPEPLQTGGGHDVTTTVPPQATPLGRTEPAVARPAATGSSAPSATGPGVALATATVEAPTPAPAQGVQTAPAPALLTVATRTPAPTGKPAHTPGKRGVSTHSPASQATVNPPGGGVVAAVVSTVSAGVSTTATGVQATVGDLIHGAGAHRDTSWGTAVPGQGAGQGAVATRGWVNPRRAREQAKTSGQAQGWRSRSRGR